MLANRTTQQSLRRFATQAVSSRSGVHRFSAPATIALQTLFVQSRSITTQKVNQSAASDILVKQRLARPLSPHLSIYRPQITWYASGLNRITGTILSGGLYVFATAYLAAPLFGWHLDSASIAAAVATWPVAAKVLAKFSLAMPFTFHCFNGLRYLSWDTGSTFANKQVIRTGWIVVGATVVSSGILAYL